MYKDYYSVVKPPILIAVRTLLIGGIRALYEFLKGHPQLLKQHKEVDSR